MPGLELRLAWLGPTSGRRQATPALSGFLALKPKFELEFKKAFQAGDIALLFSEWTLSGTDPEGNAIEMEGRTSDVARRQPDGSWLVVIDDPYGAASTASAKWPQSFPRAELPRIPLPRTSVNKPSRLLILLVLSR